MHETKAVKFRDSGKQLCSTVVGPQIAWPQWLKGAGTTWSGFGFLSDSLVLHITAGKATWTFPLICTSSSWHHSLLPAPFHKILSWFSTSQMLLRQADQHACCGQSQSPGHYLGHNILGEFICKNSTLISEVCQLVSSLTFFPIMTCLAENVHTPVTSVTLVCSPLL